MIGKQLKNKSFRATLDYVLGKEESHLIGGNMAGTSSRTLSAEFKVSQCLRPNLERVCYHGILSLPHRSDDHPAGQFHEALDDYQWTVIADEYLQRMGFEDCQHVLVRHQDTEHEHLHIIASRINLNGEVVSDSWDYYRSEAVIRKLEREFKLEPVTPSWESKRRGQTQFEIHNDHESRRQLQQTIDAAVVDQPSMAGLFTRLQQLGIEPRLKLEPDGDVQGISFGLEAASFSGTKLGRKYTWSGLQKHSGVSYEPRYAERLFAIAGQSATVERQRTKKQTAQRTEAESAGGSSGDLQTVADHRAQWERLLQRSRSLTRTLRESNELPGGIKPEDGTSVAGDRTNASITGRSESEVIERGDVQSGAKSANGAARVPIERSATGDGESIKYGPAAKSDPRTDAGSPKARAGESLGFNPVEDRQDEGGAREPEESHVRYSSGQSKQAWGSIAAYRRNATNSSGFILGDKTAGSVDHGTARSQQSSEGESSGTGKGDQKIHTNADQPQGDSSSEWVDGVRNSEFPSDNIGAAIHSTQDSSERKDGSLRGFQAGGLDIPQYGGQVSGSHQEPGEIQEIGSQFQESASQASSQRQAYKDSYTKLAGRVTKSETNYEDLVKLAGSDDFKGSHLDKGVAIQALRQSYSPQMAAKILGQSPYVQHQLQQQCRPRAEVIRYVEATLNQAHQEIQRDVAGQHQRSPKRLEDEPQR